ncbi:glucose-6-phosphate isomerase [Pseudoruegeria sp. SHC-113]|uniref:glucose-6-phosphate isomerase n=1 Tax=Pseudoruegeria sp. SHC-113 TaxID=2855439 RepID=UPI0021BAC618|nr:glucose-6-phosphate isomerase [Pseudoruegeria sp. SHC-113]MCT8160576.1 glucose-6-phosphate isomerase [Pseudoruegeria sp. SHC-113]
MTWKTLHDLHAATEGRRILSLFDDPKRAEAFSARFGDMLFDFSKTNIDAQALDALVELARGADVEARRTAMFTGEKINETEGRAVLHTALRNLDERPIFVDGENVMPKVMETLERMGHFAESVRSGQFKGQGGAITDVVNIGIGGSDLGPVMATLALAPYHDGPRLHYVSNVDGAHIADVLRPLNPETTLVLVASKTFTTIETMTNADTAKAWMGEVVKDPASQFAALSSNLEKTGAYGIDPERVFGFEDWVGGRYSMWGPIGLPVMIAVGAADFRAFLAGGLAMDKHFCEVPLAENLPVLLALVGIWHNQICGHGTRAVLPYEQRLLRLPAYLQQLEMESNGKRVSMDGKDLERNSGPVVWGEPGTNGQHAFYQLIHQGTRVIPCEFMVAAEGHEPELAHQHTLLVANCLAQSEALLRGRSLEEATEIMAKKGLEGAELERQARHRVFPGNRPSTTLVYPKLTPEIFGQIIALYEHRVFVEGVILGLNSFDQWGVELGKELALALQPVVTGQSDGAGKDGSTLGLVNHIRGLAG